MLPKEIDPNLSIAIVEDDMVSRVLMRRFLEKIGFRHVMEASDVLQIVRRIESGRVQCVICDWYLKNSSGLELLELVRGTENTRLIPFIMVTKEDRKEFVVQALKAGASAYLVKPLRLDEFRRTLLDVIVTSMRQKEEQQ